MGQLSLFESEPTAPVLCARDQAALALVPFAVAAADRSQPYTVAYQAEVDGKLQRVAIVLRPGVGLELPSQSDQIVLLALLQLTLQSERRDGLNFRRSQVLELLGWSDAGRYYQRLKGALERLTAMTISMQSVVSRRGKEYRRDRANHLIEAFDIGEGHDADCFVKWGELVLEAFELEDFKRLDWSLVLRLDNPLTVQFYRLLDRVVSSGERSWRVGWGTLATALGMGNYSAPSRFRDKLQPHIDRMLAEDVIESVEYERGGTFVFHVSNYLRAQLRSALTSVGCYPEAARQLVAGYDEVTIIQQFDCYQHGLRKASGVGYLVEAIRQGYELRYPEDDADAFVALLEMFSAPEVQGAVTLARKLGLRVHGEPAAWVTEARAVVRFALARAIDVERC